MFLISRGDIKNFTRFTIFALCNSSITQNWVKFTLDIDFDTEACSYLVCLSVQNKYPKNSFLNYTVKYFALEHSVSLNE